MNVNKKTVMSVLQLIRHDKPITLSQRMSTRMIKCASQLPVGTCMGWQMVALQNGNLKVEFFGEGIVGESDLKWMTENVAKTKRKTLLTKYNCNSNLYELFLPISLKPTTSKIGFGAERETNINSDTFLRGWPEYYSDQLPELIAILRSVGGCLKASFGSCTPEEEHQCIKHTTDTWGNSKISLSTYIGRPVKSKVFLQLQSEPSIRLLSVLDDAIPGIQLKKLGNMKDAICQQAWENPLEDANVLPDYAARIIMLEPYIEGKTMIGIQTCEEPVAPIAASHENKKTKESISVGKALFTSGDIKDVLIDDIALKMHWDIIGMTGTGKSSLMAQSVISAIETGHGCTVLDPHGTLVDSIIRRVPEEETDRIRVVRIGDGDQNPVPISIYKTSDVKKEEVNINNICTMFSDIYDPKREGIVGPRWFRMYSLLVKASLTLGLGGTFESVLTIVQSKRSIRAAMDALQTLGGEEKKHSCLVDALANEFYLDKSSEYANMISWFISKFQRFTAVPQLRNIFGASENALDFENNIDTDVVTLIDLSLPKIGTDAAKITGMLILEQLWQAILNRKDRNKTHMIMIDEAHQFQGKTLCSIIYEGRKFGAALCMAHQSCSQMMPDIRDALDTTANFSCFRLSLKDAYNAAHKFDNPRFETMLCRLDNFNAITTMSIDGKQTNPFTLLVSRPEAKAKGDEIAQKIEKRSLDVLVKPYENKRAKTTEEIIKEINKIITSNMPPRINEEE